MRAVDEGLFGTTVRSVRATRRPERRTDRTQSPHEASTPYDERIAGVEGQRSRSCTAGQTNCSGSCPTGQTVCDGTCVTLSNDRANCGMCGNACPTGQTCVTGQCSLVCATGSAACSGVCLNTMTDNAHCGMCNHACPSGQPCANGSCAPVCLTTLSNIRAGDFRIQFTVTTSATAVSELVSQRATCSHGMFWDIRMHGTGVVFAETDDTARDVCTGADSTQAFVGTLTGLCVSR